MVRRVLQVVESFGPRAALLVVVLGACSGESEPAGHGGRGAGGRQTAGAGDAGSDRPSSGGAPVGIAAGGATLSGGPSAGGGSSDSGATSATGGMAPRAGETGTGGALDGAGGATTGGGADSLGEGGASAAASGGAPNDAGAGGADLVSSAGKPCDIYASGSTPCVAAYSTVRALFESFDGPLYQVRRADGETKEIGLLAPGGHADAAAQDAFCGADACTLSIVFDQSGQGNHLTKAPPDCYLDTADDPSSESDAKARALKISGHDVYALEMNAHDGYRCNETSGMPTGGDPQGIYEVVDGHRFGPDCCWDFGNGSTDNCPGPVGTANALFFGTAYWGRGAGDGPWFMAHFDTGVWAGGEGASTTQNLALPSTVDAFAFGTLKTLSQSYTIRVGSGQAGNLTTAYDGPAPHAFQMQGAITLGLSSDASDSSYGTFFEGAITRGRPSDAVDDAVLRNVQAAGYGK